MSIKDARSVVEGRNNENSKQVVGSAPNTKILCHMEAFAQALRSPPFSTDTILAFVVILVVVIIGPNLRFVYPA